MKNGLLAKNDKARMLLLACKEHPDSLHLGIVRRARLPRQMNERRTGRRHFSVDALRLCDPETECQCYLRFIAFRADTR
jgi:hypothetical protein